MHARTGPRRQRARGAAVDAQHHDLDMALGEGAEMAPRDARLRRVLLPAVVLGIHHEGGAVARRGIGEAPAGDVLPDRLVAVLVDPRTGSGAGALAPEHAALERALLLERGEG